VLFISCAIIGHTTSVDLSRFTGLLFGALLAVVIVSVLGIFIPALRGSLLIGYAGLIVFLGLTAFDMQKIKQYYYVPDEKIKGNLAVYSAFQLYLDFINILLYILRILGNSKSRR
jgi:FtsH-binding integral membrane protein